jgi:hypothetical protein
MAAYEFARTLKKFERSPAFMEALQNLRTYFSAIPDVELAKTASFPHTEPQSSPMFLAGVRELDHPEPLIPFRAGKNGALPRWPEYVGWTADYLGGSLAYAAT